MSGSGSATEPDEGFPFKPHFPIIINTKKFNTCSLNHMVTEPCPPVNNPKIPIPNPATTRNFKTQLCRRFRLGVCALGSKCNYAHGVAELRRQGSYPLAHQTFGDSRARVFQEPKRLCRMFIQRKQCTFGDSCRFLHLSSSSREGNAMMGNIATGTTGNGKGGGYGPLELKRVFSERNFDSQRKVMPNAKSCINWEMKGYCSFGNICRFPHGLAELGNLDGYSSAEYRVMQTSAAAATNASTTTVATGPLHKKEPCGVKCIFKRNELQKISRIYADWI